MAHPHGCWCFGWAGAEEQAVTAGRRRSVRPYSPRPVSRHLAAELQGHELGAVADAEDGDAELVDRGVEAGRALDVDRLGPAREDQAGRARARRPRPR